MVSRGNPLAFKIPPGWFCKAIPGLSTTRGLYSRYETGELNIPIRLLVALHQIYHCSYDCFFEGLTLGEMS